MFDERLDLIAWGDFGTAYGPAMMVPDQLRRLAGSDREDALAAGFDLCSGLCHQHVQVGSAALPALPFLLEVLDSADREMAVQLLDILVGFALGVNRRRSVEYQLRLGRTEPRPEKQWITDLRAAMIAELPRFEGLAASSDETIARFAGRILAELREGLGSYQGDPADPLRGPLIFGVSRRRASRGAASACSGRLASHRPGLHPVRRP
jgi:hypothetical protein